MPQVAAQVLYLAVTMECLENRINTCLVTMYIYASGGKPTDRHAVVPGAVEMFFPIEMESG